MRYEVNGLPWESAVADTLSKQERSALMSRIRGTNTGTERRVFSALRRYGVYFARHAKELPGKPDVVFRRVKLAVFIDGDFWHGRHYDDWKDGLTDFWRIKIEGNMVRDRRARAKLRAAGWSVLRFWSKDIDKDPESCVRPPFWALSQTPMPLFGQFPG